MPTKVVRDHTTRTGLGATMTVLPRHSGGGHSVVAATPPLLLPLQQLLLLLLPLLPLLWQWRLWRRVGDWQQTPAAQCPAWTASSLDITTHLKMGGSHGTCPSTPRVYGYPPGPGWRCSPCVSPAEAPAYWPQRLPDGNWALETLGCCHRQCPPIHWRPLLRWGQLEGLPLALPDGHECVATGGPQVVFVLFIALLPLPGSSAELGVLKLMTVVTVKQATMELGHCGSVRMIAIHG